MDAEVHPLLRLARHAIATHVQGLAPLTAEGAGRPPQGCFVSLKLGDSLRGCVGTVLPTRETLEAEVAANACAAASRDPRFPPVRHDELAGLHIALDLLSPLEPVQTPEELDPARYGLVLQSGKRTGVLLPAIAGVESVSDQVAICRRKAGVAPDAPVTLLRFQVERIREQI